MHATLSLQYPLLPADDNAEFAAAAELSHIKVLLVSSNSLSIAIIYCAVLKNGLGQVALQASLAVLQKQYVTCLANSGTVGARTSARVCIPRASRPEWVSLLLKPRIDTVQILVHHVVVPAPHCVGHKAVLPNRTSCKKAASTKDPRQVPVI